MNRVHGHIAVIGAWHLGTVATAIFARWGHHVRIYERDTAIRSRLKAGNPPVSEPGLAEELSVQDDRIYISETPEDAIKGCATVFVAYDTPVADDGRLDTAPIFEAVEQAANHAPRTALLLVHSQVPVGTGRQIERRLERMERDDLLFAETPENLRLGTALDDFASPGFMTVGSSSKAATARALAFWQDTGAQISACDLATAELSKHVINSTLATAVALGNEISRAAHETGANGMLATRLAKRDSRIGKMPLLPGMPFGGGNLGRDLRVLAELLGDGSLPAAVERSNERHLGLLANRIWSNSPQGAIAMLGLTYKPGTSTLRFSMPLELAGQLVALGNPVRAFDPQIALDDPILQSYTDVTVVGSLLEALEGVETVVICLALSSFRELDLGHLARMGITTVHDLAGALDPSSASAPIRVLGP